MSDSRAGISAKRRKVNVNVLVPYDEFLCPILKSLMKRPVVASDGFTYERKGIVKVLKTKHTSPITNLPMDSRLIPNQALRKMISEWKQNVGYVDSDSEEEEDDEDEKEEKDEDGGDDEEADIGDEDGGVAEGGNGDGADGNGEGD